MQPTLSLQLFHAAGEGEAARLTSRLAEELSRPGNIRAEAQVRPARPGERAADVPLLGQLALTFLGGGAATALINIIGAWLPRKSETKIVLKLADGTELSLSGTDLTPTQTSAYIKALQKYEPASHGG
ncbi:MAG TPA: hypothetical protein VF705_04510 [Longimicrobium sp.]|jgi:ferric-dicitrate binding protein FerR (iron transport regulator)